MVYAYLSDQWVQIGSVLEHLRLGAIAQIETAPDRAAVDAALAGFATAMEALQ